MLPSVCRGTASTTVPTARNGMRAGGSGGREEENEEEEDEEEEEEPTRTRAPACVSLGARADDERRDRGTGRHPTTGAPRSGDPREGNAERRGLGGGKAREGASWIPVPPTPTADGSGAPRGMAAPHNEGRAVEETFRMKNATRQPAFPQ